MNGQTMSQLPEIVGKGDNADKVKEVNFSTKYNRMLNSKDRKLPVAPHLESVMLGRGYVHTDRVVHEDDLTQDVRLHALETETDPLKALAKIADVLAKNQLVTTEQLKVLTSVVEGKKENESVTDESEEVSFPRKRTRTVKNAEAVTESDESENNVESSESNV